MLSSGVFSALKADTGIGVTIVAELIGSVGLGILQTSPIFPILAPIDVSLNANALAFFMFARFLSQVTTPKFPLYWTTLIYEGRYGGSR